MQIPMTRARRTFKHALRRIYVRAGVEPYLVYQRHRRTDPGTGVTVVTVNFDSLECVKTLVEAVRRFSPPEVEILVVDNRSRDGSRTWLKQEGAIRSILLPTNLGHGPALDIGFLSARTPYLVALDVDAFPVRSDWLTQLLAPLDEVSTVSGASYRDGTGAGFSGQPYIHPCCLAIKRDRFVAERHSFAPREQEWDTGELISLKEADHLHRIFPSSIRGPGGVGTVFGEIVYHNFYGTRFRRSGRSMIDGIDRDDPGKAWAEALEKYLGHAASGN